MTTNKAILALALGLVFVSTAGAQNVIQSTTDTMLLMQPAMTQPMTAEQAKAKVRAAGVVLPPKPGASKYTQESVNVDGNRVSVMEDWKHKNVCYITDSNSASRPTISCVPMH